MINIKTESHGLCPSFPATSMDTPRIAFVEPVAGRQPVPIREGGLLIVPASDLSLEAVRGEWYSPLLGLGEPFCSWAKSYALKRSIRQGEYPNCPLSLTDAKVVLAFFEELRRAGCKELTISCEYGKSRSVTTANVLNSYQRGVMVSVEQAAKATHFNTMFSVAIPDVWPDK